jgi:CheY-like chemotaxis protein
MGTVLIVDDNDRYASHLINYFNQKNIPTQRAVNAVQGFEMFSSFAYATIISDVTMETQISGLKMVRSIFKSGYKGEIIIATTGFDVKGVMFIGRLLLPIYAGVGWMIPKVPLKRGEVLFYPTTLGNQKLPQFI